MHAARRWLALAVVQVVTGGLWAQQPTTNLLRLDEDKIRFQLLPKSELELPLLNTSDKVIEGSFLIELIDTNGKISASKAGIFREDPGTTVERIAWDAHDLPSDSPSQLGWYRLRYTITPKEGFDFAPASGIVQLGRFITDLFEIRMTAADQVTFGAKYPVRVRIDNPNTGRPYAAVPVELKLQIDDDDDHAVKHRVTTDHSGYAMAVFHLPKNVSHKEGEVTVTAARGHFREEDSLTFQFPKQPRLTLSTDKPLYQPGQMIHMRVLAIGPDRRALKNANINLKIEGEERREQFQSSVTTSKFGVATADWEVPQKVHLGDYSVTAEIESSDRYDTFAATSEVRISRYELPTFTVTVSSDRSYYVPGQDATIEVQANYLFGKPVQSARVRVVRQNERHWDSKEQKWVADESSAIEGRLDSAGRSVARIDVKRDFEELKRFRNQRYMDLTLAAYVTDVSTGRTEQRRFQLRLSSQPIHLYLTAADAFDNFETWSNAGSLQFFVTSSYADGTPASVEGSIDVALPNGAGDFDDKPDRAHRVNLARFHTNRYGVGRVELPSIPESLLTVPHSDVWYDYQPEWLDYYRDLEGSAPRRALMLLRASDGKGHDGNQREEISFQAGGDYMRVRTDHALYHAGDSITVKIFTNTKVNDLIVNLSTSGELLVSRVVHPNHGQAELTVPYDSRFQGELTIVVHAMTSVGDENRALAGVTRIIYPARQELQVGLRMPQTTFRPGENARADLRVRTPAGDAVESALGVLVFDRAVAERVRTDHEFGREYGFSIFDYFTSSYYASLAGVTYRDLLNLDSKKPFPDGMDLVAEAILRAGFNDGNVELSRSFANYDRAAPYYFKDQIEATVKRVKDVLNDVYLTKARYPKTEGELSAELREGGIDPGKLRDPWDMPYHPVFSVSGAFDVLALVSNGVDKRPDTRDDFTVKKFHWPYFRKIGKAIDAAAVDYQANTGGYIRDYLTLLGELKKKNIDLDSIRDPWGRPYSYRFQIQGPYFSISTDSAGPDGRFDSKTKRSADDVHEWTSRIHYFQQETADLNRALAEHFAETGKFPRSEEELKVVLEAAKLTPARLLDPWGHPYRFTFHEQSRYADRIEIQSYSVYPDQPRRVTEVTPVTQKLAFIHVVSDGPENNPSGSFPVAEFNRLLTEQSSKDIRAMAMPKELPKGGGSGGVSGTVTDARGAVIRGAIVVVETESEKQYTTKTNDQGTYTFLNLPAGICRLQFVAPGFRERTVLRVPVQRAATTKVDVSLDVGSVSETVEVTAEAPTLATQSATLSTRSAAVPNFWMRRASSETAGTPASKPLFTPRLRQYFPETLLWRPEVITDKHGYAHISFPMADNITAWKMSVVASTEAGEVGVAEKQLRTFQPFFVEHDPPKVLTQGDRVSLPVVLRNYSGNPQVLETELKLEPWFSILSSPRQNVTVAPDGDASAVFTFRADSANKHGKQRVTARNTQIGDAVEREVAVHPDGQEISFSVAKLLASQDNSFNVQIPGNAMPGSADAELRLYPNLVAHVLDALHGIGERPSGCGEQITSTGYVSLLALQLLNKGAVDNKSTLNPRSGVIVSAKKAVQQAHDLLIDLQQPDGGFSYWGNKSSDPALTAYILRFVSGAAEFIQIDTKLVSGARNYLIAQQAKNGAWPLRNRTTEKESIDDANLTAYIARALATTVSSAKDKERQTVGASLKSAMDYLEDRIDSWKDPYLVGNYALAAVTSGWNQQIARAEVLLKKLAHDEGATRYWNLEANTSPFYGWGYAGRVETTALAVEALSLLERKSSDPDLSEQVNRGLQYLLNHKDRYAVWYSTQATQNVIEAIIAAMPSGDEPMTSSQAKIIINGRSVASVQLPAPKAVAGAVNVELGQYLEKGTNRVQIVRSGDPSPMNVFVLTTYFVRWNDSRSTVEESVARGDTRALRLKTQFDRNDPKLSEPVHCRVEAERIGFRGYGMMLAEIGLPPGAEVDRASLERAISGSVEGYEVQPDRVVFYLWPSAGGSTFEFQFRLRFRMEAMTAASLLYDYYNPEANTTVRPVRFTVH